MMTTINTARDAIASITAYFTVEELHFTTAENRWSQCNAAIGRRMRELRGSMGLSLRDVAKRLGCSAPHLYNMEMGYRNWNRKWLDGYAKIARLHAR